MKEEDMTKLSEEELQKIERVQEAFTKRLNAEAKLESQKKYRILFERASVEVLPFIVYVIYMGAVGLIVLFNILQYTDVRLWIGSLLLFIIMVLPLFVLPNISWKNLFSYLKNKITGNKEQNEENLPIV